MNIKTRKAGDYNGSKEKSSKKESSSKEESRSKKESSKEEKEIKVFSNKKSAYLQKADFLLFKFSFFLRLI